MDRHDTVSPRLVPVLALVAAVSLSVLAIISPALDGPRYRHVRSAQHGYEVPLVGALSAAGAMMAGVVAVRRAHTHSCLFRATALGIPALSILLLGPASLVRIHPSTPRHQCAYHLKQIGHALLLYADRHRNRYPDHLDQLLAAGLIEPRFLTCPATKSLQSQSPSYVYLGRGMTNAESPEVVVAYERPGYHGDTINLLYGDGHVESVSGSLAERTLRLLGAGTNPPLEPPPPATAPAR